MFYHEASKCSDGLLGFEREDPSSFISVRFHMFLTDSATKQIKTNEPNFQTTCFLFVKVKLESLQTSKHIEFEDENEDLHDEVDLFHANDRKLSENDYKRKTVKEVGEVLNVEGDSSEDDGSSDSDFDDDSGNESGGVVGNEWGRNRKNFYGTEYIDEDWGGMRDEELDDAELEEEDAASRQAALDKAVARVADFFDRVDEADSLQTVVKETKPEWKLSTVKKLNMRTVEIIEEYNRRKDLMKVVVEPLVPLIKQLSQMSNVRKQLMLVFDVYTTYIMNMMFFLRLKADSLARRNVTDVAVDSHPVLEKIEKFAKMMKNVDDFLNKNAGALKKLVKKVSNGERIDTAVVEPQSKRNSQVCTEKKVVDETVDMAVAESSSELLLSDDRRKANKKIEKNSVPMFKGKRKKNPRIAKTKNRRRYKEAVKKVHSQVGTIRKELEKYTGESRGIRMSTSDEEVIFTAQRQTQVQNDCRFVASSVVKKRELISVSGKISDTYDKFCYADVKKYGRVFVPYSSRNDFNKPWLGKGAEVGKTIQMKASWISYEVEIFRQPDINNCRYVAWSINMNLVDEKKGSEKVPDVANGQIGIIVICPEDGDLAVYSSQSGTARLPSSLRKPWMSLGTCIRYDLIKKVDAESRAVWIVRSVENLGLLYEVIDDEMDSSKLLLRLHAVVNRVSLNARSAWLWNDVIGRIFVPAQQFNHGLRAMVCVKLIVVWTGLFEDVPWSATHIDLPPPVLPPAAAPVNSPKTPTLIPNEAVTEQNSVFSSITTHVANSSSSPLSPVANGTVQASPVSHVFSSESSEAYSDRHTMDAFDLDSYKKTFLPWADTDFLKWAPRLTPVPLPEFDSLPLSISRSSSTSATNDVSTQTDVLSEHQVLADIINNKDLFDVRTKLAIRTYNARTLASESSLGACKQKGQGTTSSACPRRDDATHSKPPITSKENCSWEHAKLEELVASAFSSRVCPWASIHSSN
uniref:Sas10 domain-containing protein n=1 Tax=Angiostrongylus cantonensis TaxID=6313 RepID=A0A158PAS6_ANGCA